MSLEFQQSEATAAQRHFPFYLVDATDGLTPETGEAAGQPQVSKNGGAWANTSATLTAVGNGYYYVVLTATELNTLGLLGVRFKSANTAEFNLTGQVVAYDPYDATPPVDVTTWDGTAVATPNTAGVPLIDQVRIVGGIVPTPTTTGVPDVNVERWLDALVTLSASLPDVNVEAMDIDSIASGVISAAELTNIENEIWDALKAAHVVANSFGDFLDIEVSSRSDFDETTDPVELLDSGGAAGTSADELVDDVWDEAKAGHVGAGSMGEEIQSHALETVATEGRLAELDAGNIPTDLSNIQSDTDDIQTRLPAALITGRMNSDVEAINDNTTAAAQLALSAEQIESGACEGTPTTTTIQTDLAETQDDIYIGRVVIFTSGNARGEATDITDYTGSSGTLEVTALANAPAASDTFVLI